MEMIKKEWKSIGKNRILLISFIVICFIPMLYASFFLKGIWDPYGKTSNLPVAVVNNDKSVTYEGKKINAGEELVNNLKEDSNLNWQFVSAKDAQDGLESRKYYMVVTIPEDFSANAATVMDTNPKQMNITYETNGALNYLGEVISDSAAKQLKSEVSSKITNQYVSTIFEKFPEIKDGFSQAADGAGQINDGTSQIATGSGTLTDNLKKLADSSLTFSSGEDTFNVGLSQYIAGVTSLDNGLTQLSDGISQLNSKVPELSDGVAQLNDGSSKLVSNNSTLQAGANSLENGISDGSTLLQAGANQLSDGLNQISSGVGKKLIDGKDQIAQLNQGLTNINNGLQDLNSTLNDGTMSTNTVNLTADLKSIGESTSQIGVDLASIKSALGVGTTDIITALTTEADKQNLSDTQKKALIKAVTEKLEAENTAIKTSSEDIDAKATSIDASTLDVSTIMKSISTSLTTLNQTVSNLSKGSKTVLPGAQAAISQLTTGLVEVKTALDGKAIPGVSQLEAGITKLQDGLKVGSTKFNAGLSDYISGANLVNNGLTELNSKIPDLKQGVSALSNGTQQAKDGSSLLVTNNASLTDGASKLVNGASQIADGSSQLYNGSNTMTSALLKLKDGSSELSSKLKDGTAEVSAVNTSSKTATMISEPTTITKDKFSNVPNYGHALAPYVLSLALYVGCLVFNFVFPIRKIAIKEKSAFEWWLSKVSVGVVAAVAMALIEGGTMILLGLSPDNLGEYYGTAIITSLTFMFLIMFLAMAFDNPGRFVAMVLLVLQLAASGGTFPMPLTDTFFKDIHQLLPMTHCIYAFRQAISSGLGTSFYTGHMVVLVCILVVSVILLLLTMMLLKAHHRESISQLDDNQKLLDDNYSYN